MSRVLLLLPNALSPPNTGARIRNTGLMQLLGEQHELDALAFGDREAQASLAQLTRRSRVVADPPPRSLVRRTLDLPASQLPDIAKRRWSPAFMHAARAMVADGDYAAVQAEGIEMARYLGCISADRRIYDAHNAEFLLQRRFSETAPSLAGRVYSRLQWRRLERFERGVVRGSRMTVAVSNHDANQLLALAGPDLCVRVVPNALDVGAYPFRVPRREQALNLLFVGKLDFRPNADALRWLIDQVLFRLPEARLFAVGAEPPAWLVQVGQHNDRVAVTGYVADEGPYLDRCAALVLPLQTGGGSRLKALIAMASGLPIVSTRVGMEGLEAEPGVHFLLAETPAEWVACLRRLADERQLGDRLAQNGRALVEQRYDWSSIRSRVRAAYDWLGS